MSQPNVLKPQHIFVGSVTGWGWEFKAQNFKVCLFVYSFGFHSILNDIQGVLKRLE